MKEHVENEPPEPSLDLAEIGAELWRNKYLMVLAPALVAALTYALTALLPPRYTAKASFLPQQSSQQGLNAAVASLGPLVGLNTPPPRNSADQFIALMQSATLTDRIIDKFTLISVYEAEYRAEARKTLLGNVRTSAGRKDGLVYIEVDDRDPKRAAAIANAHVEELQAMLAHLAVTEAQQRRKFFEGHLAQAKTNLTRAQVALETSNLSGGVLRTEPKAAAEEYARLKGEVVAAEVRVQSLRGFLSDKAPELVQAQVTLAALKQQLARAESSGSEGRKAASSDYISRFREYKYQETLFELFARQYEAARVDESREGALVQVVDLALPPELPSAPRRARISAGSGAIAALILALFLMIRRSRTNARN